MSARTRIVDFCSSSEHHDASPGGGNQLEYKIVLQKGSFAWTVRRRYADFESVWQRLKLADDDFPGREPLWQRWLGTNHMRARFFDERTKDLRRCAEVLLGGKWEDEQAVQMLFQIGNFPKPSPPETVRVRPLMTVGRGGAAGGGGASTGAVALKIELDASASDSAGEPDTVVVEAVPMSASGQQPSSPQSQSSSSRRRHLRIDLAKSSSDDIFPGASTSSDGGDLDLVRSDPSLASAFAGGRGGGVPSEGETDAGGAGSPTTTTATSTTPPSSPSSPPTTTVVYTRLSDLEPDVFYQIFVQTEIRILRLRSAAAVVTAFAPSKSERDSLSKSSEAAIDLTTGASRSTSRAAAPAADDVEVNPAAAAAATKTTQGTTDDDFDDELAANVRRVEESIRMLEELETSRKEEEEERKREQLVLRDEGAAEDVVGEDVDAVLEVAGKRKAGSGVDHQEQESSDEASLCSEGAASRGYQHDREQTLTDSNCVSPRTSVVERDQLHERVRRLSKQAARQVRRSEMERLRHKGSVAEDYVRGVEVKKSRAIEKNPYRFTKDGDFVLQVEEDKNDPECLIGNAASSTVVFPPTSNDSSRTNSVAPTPLTGGGAPGSGFLPPAPAVSVDSSAGGAQQQPGVEASASRASSKDKENEYEKENKAADLEDHVPTPSESEGAAPGCRGEEENDLDLHESRRVSKGNLDQTRRQEAMRKVIFDLRSVADWICERVPGDAGARYENVPLLEAVLRSSDTLIDLAQKLKPGVTAPAHRFDRQKMAEIDLSFEGHARVKHQVLENMGVFLSLCATEFNVNKTSLFTPFDVLESHHRLQNGDCDLALEARLRAILRCFIMLSRNTDGVLVPLTREYPKDFG